MSVNFNTAKYFTFLEIGAGTFLPSREPYGVCANKKTTFRKNAVIGTARRYQDRLVRKILANR